MRNREEARKGLDVLATETVSEEECAIKLERLRAEIQKALDAEAAGRVVDGEAAFRRLLERLK
jgi:hypothetical protein